ncbi:MAG: hypothetical protein V4564_10705 [Pseudomonadota bacterium]
MSRRIKYSVLKLLRHLLCLGILFGLAGNGVAVAAPCILMAHHAQPAMIADMPGCEMGALCPDCGAKDMANHKNGKDKAPGCMAMAACTTALATKESVAAASAHYQTPAAGFWPAAVMLAGRDVAPEPEPPTLFG